MELRIAGSGATWTDWTELQTLVAIVDTGSLAAAARRLSRSPPSVTRDLADLERRVGTGLVERSTRSCRPTPAGLRMADQGRQLLADYAEALGRAAGETSILRGPLRVTAPSTLGREHVATLIIAFLDTYSGVSIDLQLLDRNVDLVEEDFDLAVRIGPLVDSSALSHPVGVVERVVVASPTYLAAREAPRHPSDLAGHELIQHTARGAGAPWRFRERDGRSLDLTFEVRLTVNQAEAAVAAARSGRGVVAALSHQVAADLEEGRLVKVLTDFQPAALPVSLLWPSSRRSWRRLRLLVDHLATGLSALTALQPTG